MSKVTTISQLEEMATEVVQVIGKERYGLPPHAIRVIIWPTRKFDMQVEPGVTAILRLTIPRSKTHLANMLDAGVRHVARGHLYQSTSIERIADIRRREEDGARFRRVKFKFHEEMVPNMIPSSELTVRHITRIEVIHKRTGVREIIEQEYGGRTTVLDLRTTVEIAKARLSRVIHTHDMSNPTALPVDNPNWIANTN